LTWGNNRWYHSTLAVDGRWVWIESHRCGTKAALARPRHHTGQDGLVTAMHSIKIADGHH
jgi:hypothetical protein